MAEIQYRTVVDACNICGEKFTSQHKTGRRKQLCSVECKAISRRAAIEKRPRLRCEIEGCARIARVGIQPICDVHYHRRYRTGRLHKIEPTYRGTTTNGYTKQYGCHGHPMADDKGVALEHRVVAYDALGAGPHPCHWCGVTLEWPAICVDHLNEKKKDNRIENLVPSCTYCNRARGSIVPFIKRMKEDRIKDLICTFGHMRCNAVE